MRFKRLLLFACMIGLVSCQSLPSDFDATKLGTVERDVTYCTMDETALNMDIYYPATKEKQWPVVVYVHGGGWIGGTKDVISEVIDAKALKEAGFVLVSVEYRFAPLQLPRRELGISFQSCSKVSLPHRQPWAHFLSPQSMGHFVKPQSRVWA